MAASVSAHSWGFLAGWCFVVGKLASCAAMALTFAAYAAPAFARPLAVLAVVALTAVNYFGVAKTRARDPRDRRDRARVPRARRRRSRIRRQRRPVARGADPRRGLQRDTAGGGVPVLRVRGVRAHRDARRGSRRPDADDTARDSDRARHRAGRLRDRGGQRARRGGRRRWPRRRRRSLPRRGGGRFAVVRLRFASVRPLHRSACCCRCWPASAERRSRWLPTGTCRAGSPRCIRAIASPIAPRSRPA